MAIVNNETQGLGQLFIRELDNETIDKVQQISKPEEETAFREKQIIFIQNLFEINSVSIYVLCPRNR